MITLSHINPHNYVIGPCYVMSAMSAMSVLYFYSYVVYTGVGCGSFIFSGTSVRFCLSFRCIVVENSF